MTPLPELAFPSGVMRKVRQRPHDSGSDWVISEMLQPTQSGMTLRDYFAAKAMQAYWFDENLHPSVTKQQAAEWAYAMADAMLLERAK